MKNVLFGFCSTLLVLTLGACGGGGSGGTTAAPPPPVAAAVINSANAETVAASSADVALQSGGLSGFIDIIGLTATSTGGVSKLSAVQTASPTFKTTVSNSVISQVPVGPVTEPCAVSGSVTISGDIANPATLAAGDFFNIDWNNCDDGQGQVVDGLLEFSITSFEGDATTGGSLLGITLTLTAFQVTEGANFYSADGDVSLTLDSRTPPVSVATMSGSTFTVGSNGSTETLSNFSTTVTENAGMFPSSYTTDAMGTITSTQFDGSVTYDTPVAFESIGDAYPYAGELLVTGADNATLRLIALDEVNVRIEADYDGDGAVDETIDTTWDALTNQ